MVPERIVAEIWRGEDPANRGHFETFEVPYEKRMSILTLLQYIYREMDPSLAFRNYTCGRGICNSCRVNLNGKTIKACNTLLRPGDHLVLRPYNARVLRDLATIIEGSAEE